MAIPSRFPTPPGGRGPSRPSPLGHADVRSANLGLVLRSLHAHGGRSRAALAQGTGLSKASVTSLVADLMDRGLVREGEVDRQGTVGRPGIEVRIDPGRAAGIGLELNAEHVTVCVLDLEGETRYRSTVPLGEDPGTPPARVAGLERVLDLTARQILTALDRCDGLGLWVAGLTVAPTGVLNREEGSVRLATSLGWHDVPLVAELGRRLGARRPVLTLENDAKLSALAEAPSLAARGIDDFVFLTGDLGVAAGIVADGRLVQGGTGLSGEVGHMTVGPAGRTCRCGRRGCWETVVGLGRVLEALDPVDPARSARLPVLERLQRVRELLDAGDPALTVTFSRLSEDLASGVGLLVDVLDPRAVVLGGYFGQFADVLAPPLRSALAARQLVRSAAPVVEVRGARHGFDSAAVGGARLALERVLENPVLVPGRDRPQPS